MANQEKYKCQNQTGFDRRHPNTNTKLNPKFKLKLLDQQFQSRLKRDTKQFPCQK